MDLTGLTGEAAVPTVPQSVFLVNKNHEKRWSKINAGCFVLFLVFNLLFCSNQTHETQEKPI